MERQPFGLCEEDLATLCRQHGVEPQLVADLLDIERRYHRQMRRTGIMDELAECVRSVSDRDPSTRSDNAG